ncbi:MAG: sodium/proline symporter PutP [Eubacteriales bacterium]|nr:sodium/proline symporter PutP [Eubacteriales bacterium]MDD3866759.1 sodium/proline symporter PutP [Eubacteriales bacterium]MDD4461463.1 sodium/proline symporter PutP [Eubacteriales bacterium]
MEITIIFIVYLIGMLAVGTYFYRRNTNISDYVLGGRTLNPFVTSLSAQASDMSGWLLLGLPGLAYLSTGGLLEATWTAVGLAGGTYLNWLLVAKRLRNYTQISGDAITLPQYFENRFRDRSHVLRGLSAFVILLFFLFYTSSGFVAGAKLFSTVFDLSYHTALIIGVLVIVSYTFLGGFKAVCWTDLFQGLLMLAAITITPIIAMQRSGGLFASFQTDFADFSDFVTNADGQAVSLIVIISWAAWGLGYFGQPHILVRFMGIRSAKEIRPARYIAMVWVLLSLAAAVVVGIAGRSYLGAKGIILSAVDSETVFMRLVTDLFPPLIAGVLLSAILAAIMSTADSQLLVTSSAITGDFYQAVFRRGASDRELLWVGRVTVILIALVAGLLASDQNSSVFKLVSYAWAGFGAAFGPVVLLSLYWPKMTRNGALAGILTGGLTVVIWKNLSGGLFDIYEIVPGILLSLVTIVTVSWLGKSPNTEITDEFAAVASENKK